MHRLSADLVLVVHFAFVAFVVGGFVLIWLGAGVRWSWVRNLWFRRTHLTAILFVAAESVLGVMCPLTVWEDALRGSSSETGFIARWIHRVMFYQLPEWIFTALYVGFALVVLATYWVIPPRRRSRSTSAPGRLPAGP